MGVLFLRRFLDEVIAMVVVPSLNPKQFFRYFQDPAGD